MKDTNPRNSRANVTVVLLNVMHANDPVALNTDIKREEKRREKEKEKGGKKKREGIKKETKGKKKERRDKKKKKTKQIIMMKYYLTNEFRIPRQDRNQVYYLAERPKLLLNEICHLQ